MSLLSTIAHEGAVPARGFSPKGIGMMAAGLALGVAVGFGIVNNQSATESSASSAASPTGLAQDEFIRLNTTAYDGMVPAAPVVVTEVQAAVNPFIEINTTALDALVPAASAAVVDPFIHINTTSYDGLVPTVSTAVIGSQSVVDSNFLYWNTDALNGLVPTASVDGQTSSPVNEQFLNWNIASLEYPIARHTEQTGGPR
ncbi:MAG: hypothetical protein V3S32_09480 [Acidimicrobiia bacterium]